MLPRTGSYANVPDFIYGITREIWEDRGIGGKLERYYAPDILLRAPTGLTTSNAGVTSQTLQTLHQFPDRQLVGEDVSWTGYDDWSFLASHRLISVMRHTGAGSYGPASHRPVRTRIIADCYVVDTVVVEEWLVRDQAAFARCLGLEPAELARSMLADDVRTAGRPVFFLPEHETGHDKPGRFRPELQPGRELELYAEGYRRLWQVKDLSAVQDLYFHGASLAAPGGESFHGWVDIDRFYLGYLASFPDAELTVHSARINNDEGQPARVALRWSLQGTHAGFGRFGAPTNAPVFVMGMSHAHVVNGRVTFEWVVTDEVSVWKQILAYAEGRAGG